MSLIAEVGPAVVQDGYTVVRLVVGTDSDESVHIGRALDDGGRYTYSMSGLRLMVLERALVFPEVNTSTKFSHVDIAEDADLELFPVFGGVPDGLSSVDVFLPNVGVALGVPVVGADEAGFDVDAALAAAEFDESVESGPFELNSVVVAADGSSDTASDDVSTTVNVSGDVLFADDSAELSDEADEVLGAVVEQLELYPSGGSLAITGHTDDVNTDEHNQDLSERRAQSVSDRLGGLADLSGWDVSVSGKGESEPRVPNDSDENRQLNRRVEVLLTPADPDEATGVAGGSSADSGDMPEAAGPVGRGPDGVDIEVDGVPARISLDSVTRVGEYLVGNVVLSASEGLTAKAHRFVLPRELQSVRWQALWQGAYNLTLLDGDKRYLLVDYLSSSSEYFTPLTVPIVYDLVAGDSRSLPVVWPDCGGDKVVLDVPGENVRVRLTDIPVVDA
ncbi:OmpA family protein [Actinomyces succiniciruminis]|nr:OmpA family protein [Actinomyces succiniciruminis]